MEFTKQQKAVLDAKGATLVKASAGTGKTAILTEKVVDELLNSPKEVTIDRVLCLTFSSAAAEEMKDRIKKKIYSVIYDSAIDSSIKSNAFYLLRYFSQSNITTIHAFALQIIKEHGLEKGYDRSVDVADEIDIVTLKRKAVETILDKEYKLRRPDFINLERYLSQYSGNIADIILKAADKIYSFADPEDWMQTVLNNYNEEYPDSIAVFIMDVAESICNNLQNVLDLCNQLDAQDKLIKTKCAISDDINIMQVVFQSAIEGDIKGISSQLLSKFGATVRMPEIEGIEAVKGKRKEAKSDFDKYFGKNFDLYEQLERLGRMSSSVSMLFELCKSVHTEYQELKKERNIIDFSDMERICLDILNDDRISTMYKNKFVRVFVDEYQDTSVIQERIIEKISYNERLFCVGDIKQSIYGFRQADASIFNERAKRYKAGEGQVLALSSNFRSNANILNCVNDVFENSQMAYSKDDSLNAGTANQENDSGCETVISVMPDNVLNSFALNSNQTEIYHIASIIKGLIGKKIPDRENGGFRDIEFKDIAVLSRNVAFMSADIQDIFTSCNIPYTLERSGNLLATPEIELLTDILSLIVNIKDDLRILSVIHSGITGLQDKDLSLIRQVDMEKGIFENLVTLSKGMMGTVSIKCKRFLEMFEYYNAQQHLMSLADLIRTIVEELKFKDYVASTVRNGAQAVANVECFISIAENFQHKKKEKLYSFLQTKELLKENDSSIPEAEIESKQNSVTIASIHKSKGLEYPVVILAFANKGFSVREKKDAFIITKEGLGLRYYNYSMSEKGDSLIRKALAYNELQNELAEEMRLLYVAMTRAKERLIIQTRESPVVKEKAQKNSYIDIIQGSIIGDKGKIREDLSGAWNYEYVSANDISSLQSLAKKPVGADDFIKEYDFQVIGNYTPPKSSNYCEQYPTAIASTSLEELLDATVPSFEFDKLDDSLTSADMGVIFHKLMRFINLKNANSVMLGSEITRLIKEGKLSSEEAKTINQHKVKKLFENPLWKAISSSVKTHKEKPIVVNIQDYKGYKFKEPLLIRGIIDLMVNKGDGWWLIDYKTDTFSTGSEYEISQHQSQHEGQLALYKAALEHCGYKVSKTLVVYLDIGSICEIK